MPTVCEIKVALKAKGIKGITGLNKSQLQSLLDGKKPPTKSTTSKPATNKPAKQLIMREESLPSNLLEKSYIFLKKKVDKIENIINNY